MITQLMSWQNLQDLGWLLFLLLVFGYFWRARHVTLQTRGWIKTRGRITRCEWVIQGHSIWPKLEYIYQVDDRDVTGKYLFLDMVHNEPYSQHARHLAYRVAKAFKDNQDVDVYYNPNQPEQAVLDTTIPRKLNVILAFIASLIVVHVVIRVIS